MRYLPVTLFSVLLLFIIVGCDLQDQDPSVSKTIPGMENVTNKHLARVVSLLDPEVTGFALTEHKTILPTGGMGAVESIGFLAPDPDIIFSVYVFEDGDSHQQAPIIGDQFLSAIGLSPSNASKFKGKYISGRNGPVLFLGYVAVLDRNVDTTDAEIKLNTLAGAFAGEE